MASFLEESLRFDNLIEVFLSYSFTPIPTPSHRGWWACSLFVRRLISGGLRNTAPPAAAVPPPWAPCGTAAIAPPPRA